MTPRAKTPPIVHGRMQAKARINPRNPKPPGTLLFDVEEVQQFLLAFGDDPDPLPETVRVLDEIITDYIIETCHEAAASAHHARRAKIKLDDFKWVLRRDPAKLGRVGEMLDMQKELQKKRKVFDTDEGMVSKNAAAQLQADDKGGAGVEKAGEKRKGGAADGEGEGKKKKKRKTKEGGDGASIVG